MDIADAAPVLAIAAQEREFHGLLSRASRIERLNAPVRAATQALISEWEWILVANGEGPRCALAALRWALQRTAPRAVLSTGYCGALDPGLEPGAIWVATEVLNPSGARYPALSPRSSLPARRGPLLSVDRIVSTAREKAHLRRLCGAGAVEMEAAAVAEAAAEKKLPFYCVRVVSDSASEDLPLDFNRYRGPGGRIRAERAAIAALGRPWAWRRLIRLARAARRASIQLGEYLAHCRF